MEQRNCRWCEEAFEPRTRHQVFCSTPHTIAYRNARRTYGPDIRMDEYEAIQEARRAGKYIPEVDDQLQVMSAKDTEAARKAELTRLAKSENRFRRLLSAVEQHLEEFEPTPLVVERPMVEHKPEHEWTLVLSDWHVGQKTPIESTGGLYHQTIAITRAQVQQLWQRLSFLREIAAGSQGIRKLNLLVLGDIVDGDDMRNSQHSKVEEPVTMQSLLALDLLVWFIRQCMTIFEVVEVDNVGGNHDRTSRKAGDAALGELGYEDTYSWLIGGMVQRMLAADIDDGRLIMRNWSTFFGFRTITGLRTVFEHGSSFKWGGGYAGLPFYGIVNATNKYKSMLDGADLIVMGHGHICLMLPHTGYDGWTVMNGALPASSTYVQSSFKTIRRPSQLLLSTHPDVGLTGFHPIYLDHGGVVKPENVWENWETLADRSTKRSLWIPEDAA